MKLSQAVSTTVVVLQLLNVHKLLMKVKCVWITY